MSICTDFELQHSDSHAWIISIREKLISREFSIVIQYNEQSCGGYELTDRFLLK